MKRKGTWSLQVTTHFECNLCGKQFHGEEGRMRRRFILHLFIKHPKLAFSALGKDLKQIIKKEQ